MTALLDHLARRRPQANEFLTSPGSRRTVLVPGGSLRAEVIAFTLLKLGCNVLVTEPWERFWLEPTRFLRLDKVFDRWVKTLRKFKVQLVLGVNAAAMVPHPKTKEPLHRAAGAAAVNFWWEDPRRVPLMARRGFTLYDYLAALRDPRMLNVFADADVCEEVRRFLAVPNVAHVPLAATPELWSTPNGPPSHLSDRPARICLIRDRDDDSARPAPADALAAQWAGRVADLKSADPQRALADCVEQIGGPGEQRGSTARRPYELAATLKEEFERWGALNATLAQRGGDALVQTAASHLGERLTLLGHGWDAVGLPSHPAPTQPGEIARQYATSRGSLCLPGGSYHSGLPPDAYQAACRDGLLLTPQTRELASLFEPGKECIAFAGADGLRAALDRTLNAPDELESLRTAGRRRVLIEHTWEQRLTRILDLATEWLGLPWR